MASTEPTNMLPLWSDLLRWSPEVAFSELERPKSFQQILHKVLNELV